MRLAFFLFLALLPALTSGCVQTRVSSPRWEKMREIADPPRGSADGSPAAARGTRYAIQLRTFSGDDRLQQAYSFAAALRETGQIPGIWFTNLGDKTVVYAGRFRRPDNDDAKRSLKSARDARFEGGRPFRRAKMTSIIPDHQGVADRWDLRPHRGLRSLMVEMYDAEVTRNFRQRAENRAAELRKETDLDVYYFLGNHQAYVSVGLFDPAIDYIMVNNVETPGPRIRELQKRFPRLQRNGKPFKSSQARTEDGIEPTIVIRVP